MESRDLAAADRDDAADRRDIASRDRDAAAARRDVRAEEREEDARRGAEDCYDRLGRICRQLLDGYTRIEEGFDDPVGLPAERRRRAAADRLALTALFDDLRTEVRLLACEQRAAAGDRRAAVQDRISAAEDRWESARDRDLSARDRDQAAIEREQDGGADTFLEGGAPPRRADLGERIALAMTASRRHIAQSRARIARGRERSASRDDVEP